MYSKNTCEDDEEAINLILELKARGEVLKEYKV